MAHNRGVVIVQALTPVGPLDDLLSSVAHNRGVVIVQALTPVGPLLDHECDISTDNLPARDILAEILRVGEFPLLEDFPTPYTPGCSSTM